MATTKRHLTASLRPQLPERRQTAARLPRLSRVRPPPLQPSRTISLSALRLLFLRKMLRIRFLHHRTVRRPRPTEWMSHRCRFIYARCHRRCSRRRPPSPSPHRRIRCARATPVLVVWCSAPRARLACIHCCISPMVASPPLRLPPTRAARRRSSAPRRTVLGRPQRSRGGPPLPARACDREHAFLW